MNAVRILIVEDEVLIAEYLKDTLNSFGFTEIRLAHAKPQALNEIDSFKPQLVLLDIRMVDELEGISIAEYICENYKTPFIFITAHSDRDIVNKALGTKPAAYITKPFKKSDVYAAISIVQKNLEDQSEKEFIFKDGYTTIKLPHDDILFVEGEGNYVHIATTHKRYTIRRSLEWCFDQLSKSPFARVHRSFIVNLKKIEKSTVHAVFINGKAIPVSRNKRIDLSTI